MPTRRDFLTQCARTGAALGATALVTGACARQNPDHAENSQTPPKTADRQAEPGVGGFTRLPVVVSTWAFGQAANAEAWTLLEGKGTALDAVERGARQAEADPENTSVGLGGLPDRDGQVTLDACVMDHDGKAGSVAFLADTLHAASVARRVMEATPHVMLVGEGAREFAREQGFPAADLLTPGAEKQWRRWLDEEGGEYRPRANRERHDTLGILSLDLHGRMAGACTTSGMAFKMHGRVGDSPIIGAALFVDGEVGAACATGHGEYVMRTLGSFLVVELMRQGLDPQKACEAAMARVRADTGDDPGEVQAAYLALDRRGRVGACSLQPGFRYAVRTASTDSVHDAVSLT